MAIKGKPPEKHFPLSVIENMQQITAPLTQHGIYHFLYSKIYDNGECYALTTHAAHYLHHWCKGYKVSMPLSFLGKNIYHFFTGNEKSPYVNVIDDCRTFFNLTYPLAIIDRQQDFCELYLFFTQDDNQEIINFYLNHREIIEAFKSYFKDKAKKLVDLSEINKIVLPDKMRPDFSGLLKMPETMRKNKIAAIEMLSPICFRMMYENREILITKREMQCLQLLQYGYSIKEIAKKLVLSPRTVEDHLNNVKQKFGVRQKTTLVRVLFQCLEPLTIFKIE